MKLLWTAAIAAALCAAHGQSAVAAEITFQSSEVDLGQDVATVAIAGNEWLGFGIDMIGTQLFVYDNLDPFPPPDDRNGIFEGDGPSFEIVFTNDVVNLEVSWWAIASVPLTITAFNAAGDVVGVESHTGEEFGTDTFAGRIKRIVVEASPAQVCIANLRFDECPTTCPQDQDMSGDVGFSDLLSVLAAWGPCAACPQDLDMSGDVGFSDLLSVLAAWGPCP